MSSNTPGLHLLQPTIGATSGWDLNDQLGALDQAIRPADMYYVSPDFTTGNLGNGSATDRRHFDTIQGAIDAASGTGMAHLSTVLVYPGVYSESLAIDGTVNIVGALPLAMSAAAGGLPVKLQGSSVSNQEPVVVISPDAAETVCVRFVNIGFKNQYNSATTDGVQIDKAMVVDLDDNTGGSYGTARNRCTFQNCQINGQTWGDNNDWKYGIRAIGWWQLNWIDSQYKANSYAGAEYNGGIEHMFYLYGTNSSANGGSCAINIRGNSTLSHTYQGDFSPTIIEGTRYLEGICTRCDFSAATGGVIFTDGGVGVNAVSGLAAEEMATYNNAAGVDSIFY